MSENRDYPLFEYSYKFLKDVPYIKEGIDLSLNKHDNVYLDFAEMHLQCLYQLLGNDLERLNEANEIFVNMTFDVLKMQADFEKKGIISPYAGQDRQKKIYHNSSLMEGPYLKGLYLAVIFWPNHFEKILFFQEQFLPLLPTEGKLIDAGCGSGVFVILTRKNKASLNILATDISPYSISMVRDLNEICLGNSRDNLTLAEGDFINVLKNEKEPFDAAIFSDVIEHITEPEKGIRKLGESLKPGSLVFFSSATNAAFYDHTIIFKDVREIESLLKANGFNIMESREVNVYKSKLDMKVLDYFAILKKA